MGRHNRGARNEGEEMTSKKGERWAHSGFLRKRGLQIALLSAIIAAALLCSLWNAAGMRRGLEYGAREYCTEVTSQMANVISDGVNSKLIELVNIADSVSRIAEGYRGAELDEFLLRKAEILDFDEMILLDRQGACEVRVGRMTDVDAAKLAAQDSVQDSFEGRINMGFFDGQTLFYAAPIETDGRVDRVLVGVRSKENMQGMLASDAFGGNTLSCIIDSRGEVILSPEDLKPFLVLESIFQSAEQMEAVEDIEQMVENIRHGREGVVRFTDVNGSENLLAYHSLGLNDWVLLTIVPANLISGSISVYIFRSFLIVGGTGLFFLALLMLLYRSYGDSQRRLTRLAFVDGVTGGMNDAAFRLRYRKAARQGRGGAIVLLNVRNFKLVKGKLGFEAGNELLRQIARAVGEGLDADRDEFAGRSETDHFFLRMAEEDGERIRARLDGMERAISARWSAAHPNVPVAFSAGCCMAGDGNTDIRSLQDRARLALGSEPTAGWVNCVFYNDGIASRVKWEQELEAMFEQALEQRQFRVYLQPKVCLRTGRPEGAEALVRWNHPARGIIPPVEFIPLLERSGEICRLDFYVFEEVCRFYEKRRDAGKRWYPVSVNLSRYHFYEDDFLDRFYAAAQAHGLPRNAVDFELTESMFADPAYNERIKRGIARMREMGFRCLMDDFGAGYSSLGLLKEFDVDALKLDRSFFLDMDSEKARDIIRSVVELAAKLRMETVAEGIEQAEQMEFLGSIHCDTVQGYIFSKPLPMDEFESWVSRYEDGQ